ncbi:hypothetical protein D3C77_392690 [compost metagenome]
MQAGQLLQADIRELPALGGLLLLHLAQHALDQVAGQLEVDHQFDDFRPALAVLSAEVLAGHLRQIQFDCVVQRFDVFAQAAHLLRHRCVGAQQHTVHSVEHVVDQVAHAQGLTHGVGQGQARGAQRRRVQVARPGPAVGLGPLR